MRTLYSVRNLKGLNMYRKPNKQEQEELELILEQMSHDLYSSGRTKEVSRPTMIRTHPTLPLAIITKEDRTKKAEQYQQKLKNLFLKAA